MDRVADKAVKETPLLFRPEMVRAVLDGRKTQTRRVLKSAWQLLPFAQESYRRDGLLKCPFGKAGDRLWVKESHYRWGRWVKNGLAKSGRQAWRFQPAGKSIIFPATEAALPKQPVRGDVGWHLRPSIFMPRWASRIALEIAGVRVERLRPISEEDAQAEGVEARYLGAGCKGFAKNFSKLWDSMRGGTEFAWSENPWVWVISFRRIDS